MCGRFLLLNMCYGRCLTQKALKKLRTPLNLLAQWTQRSHINVKKSIFKKYSLVTHQKKHLKWLIIKQKSVQNIKKHHFYPLLWQYFNCFAGRICRRAFWISEIWPLTSVQSMASAVFPATPKFSYTHCKLKNSVIFCLVTTKEYIVYMEHQLPWTFGLRSLQLPDSVCRWCFLKITHYNW